MEGAVDIEKHWDEWLQHLELLQQNNAIEDGWICVKVTIIYFTYAWLNCISAPETVITTVTIIANYFLIRNQHFGNQQYLIFHVFAKKHQISLLSLQCLTSHNTQHDNCSHSWLCSILCQILLEFYKVCTVGVHHDIHISASTTLVLRL